MRSLSYPNTDVFAVCFSLVNPISLENVKNVWIPEVRELVPDAEIILVGTMLDLRMDFEADDGSVEKMKEKGYSPVPSSVGENVAKDYGCYEYCEVSAMKGINMIETFTTIGYVALHIDEIRNAKQNANNQQADVNCNCLII